MIINQRRKYGTTVTSPRTECQAKYWGRRRSIGCSWHVTLIWTMGSGVNTDTSDETKTDRKKLQPTVKRTAPSKMNLNFHRDDDPTLTSKSTKGTTRTRSRFWTGPRVQIDNPINHLWIYLCEGVNKVRAIIRGRMAKCCQVKLSWNWFLTLNHNNSCNQCYCTF